jgi:hypothetical protein
MVTDTATGCTSSSSEIRRALEDGIAAKERKERKKQLKIRRWVSIAAFRQKPSLTLNWRSDLYRHIFQPESIFVFFALFCGYLIALAAIAYAISNL